MPDGVENAAMVWERRQIGLSNGFASGAPRRWLRGHGVGDGARELTRRSVHRTGLTQGEAERRADQAGADDATLFM